VWTAGERWEFPVSVGAVSPVGRLRGAGTPGTPGADVLGPRVVPLPSAGAARGSQCESGWVVTDGRGSRSGGGSLGSGCGGALGTAEKVRSAEVAVAAPPGGLACIAVIMEAAWAA
jgi:hypothetical protein